MARDDLLFELHKQTTQSPTDRNVSGVFGSIHAHTLILRPILETVNRICFADCYALFC